MKIICIFLLQIIAIIWSAQGSLTKQRFAIEPQDQFVIIDSRVTLPCRVVNRVGEVEWTLNDYRVNEQNSHYNIVGSEEGDFSLQIFPVNLGDEGRYQCKVGYGEDGQFGIQSRFANLEILIPAQPPKITQGDKLIVWADREIELECISPSGKPAAVITWIDSMGKIFTSGITYKTKPIPDTRRYTAISLLKFTPSRKNDKNIIKCEAQNAANMKPGSAALLLDVKYPPEVSLFIIGGKLADGTIAKGADVVFECHVDANPIKVSYLWYINDNLPVSEHTHRLLIRNISKKYVSVKCEANNEVGRGVAHQTLDIDDSVLQVNLLAQTKDDIPLWILISVTVSVLAIALTIIILCLLYFKCRATENQN